MQLVGELTPVAKELLHERRAVVAGTASQKVESVLFALNQQNLLKFDTSLTIC